MKNNHSKIINIIRFNGNFDLLDSKIQNSIGENWLIVSANSTEDVIMELQSKFQKTKKVFFDENVSTYFNLIDKEIRKNLFDFDCIITVGEDFEIIDFSKIKELEDKILYNPIVLKHKNYTKNLTFRRKTNVSGHFCFTLSQFLIQKNLLENLQFIKGTDSRFTDFFHDNGWSLPFCISNTDEAPIGYQEDKLIGFNVLSKYEKPIHPKKILITESDSDDFEAYDYIVRVNFDSNILNEKMEMLSEKKMKFDFILPKKNIYGSEETFISNFKSNKIQELELKFKIRNEDVIDFK